MGLRGAFSAADPRPSGFHYEWNKADDTWAKWLGWLLEPDSLHHYWCIQTHTYLGHRSNWSRSNWSRSNWSRFCSNWSRSNWSTGPGLTDPDLKSWKIRAQSWKVERSKTCGLQLQLQLRLQLQAAVAAAAGVAASCITRVRGSQHRFEKLKDPSIKLNSWKIKNIWAAAAAAAVAAAYRFLIFQLFKSGTFSTCTSYTWTS